MTVRRFGRGDQYIPGVRDADGPDEPDEATFQAREYFVDILQEEAPEAYDDFRQRVEPTFGGLEPTFREVFDAPGDPESLQTLLEQWWESPPSEWSPYAEAFLGWPPPIPRGTPDRPLDQVIRIALIRWRFHAWLLTSILGDELYSWSEAWHLEENLWVASHLLARSCKARLLFHGDEAQRDVNLDHVVFGSPGVLAPFKDSMDKSFGSFPEWDPTQEEWGKWRKAAEDPFRKALANYEARVLEQCEVHHLSPTPEKRESERDFRRLVRFQVLGKTQRELREKDEDLKAVQRVLRRTAKIVGLRRRKPL